MLRILAEIPLKLDTNKRDYENAESCSRVLNIGNGSPVSLMEFVDILENVSEKRQELNLSNSNPAMLSLRLLI